MWNNFGIINKNQKLYCIRAPFTKYQKTYDLLVNTPNSEIKIIYTSYGNKKHQNCAQQLQVYDSLVISCVNSYSAHNKSETIASNI